MRKLAVTPLVIFVLLPAACLQPTESVSREEPGEERAAIIGAGARADNTHMAVVAVRGESGQQCTGTIVHRSAKGGKVHVLTAAHCCKDSSPPKEIRVGFDYDDPSVILPVDSFERHPCYEDRSSTLYGYDVCVVTARGSGALNVSPIQLASAPDELTVGGAVTLVGYGITPTTNTSRRKVEASVSDVAPFTFLTDQTNERGGLCYGDSGGPALIPQGGVEVVAGVITLAAGGELCNVAGGFARVTFPGIRDEFLDKVLAGRKSRLQGLWIQRRGDTPGPVRDTYIASDQPEQSFGDRADLLVGAPPNTDAIRSALLRFELAAVPRGATLLTARVGLRVASTSGPGTISVHRVVRDWDESESWASFGPDGFDPTPVATYGNETARVRAEGVLSLDLTGLVASWLGGETDDHGILLRADDREQTQLLASDAALLYHSSRPWMHLCYLLGPP
ncbi:DNRLRE domain-containing protein [Sorangium sp. So ce726]|uniref:DNRLRE domain-containing protein n=1 Tax=Sorangium sp. So ce726 TaxID=3133319 RepID=UPI003F6158FD